MKLGEFSTDAVLAELGPNPQQQQAMAAQAAAQAQGPSPADIAARAREVAAKKQELTQIIRQKTKELIDLRQQLASIR
jgi:ATP-dependent protease ClpP protease subunit